MKHPSTELPEEAQRGREWIVEKAYQVFREKGYYHTSMADIGAACGLQKGSLYHHFANKETLARAILELAYRQFKEQVFDLAGKTEVSPHQRLQQMLAALDTLYFEQPGGCLMARMGLEVANELPEFTAVIRQFFAHWVAAFAQLFQSRQDAGQAAEQAQRAVTELEGAILLACIYDDKQYFTTACQRIGKYLE